MKKKKQKYRKEQFKEHEADKVKIIVPKWIEEWNRDPRN